MQYKRSLESQALNNQKTKSLLDAITSKNLYSMCIQYTFNGYSIYTFNVKQYTCYLADTNLGKTLKNCEMNDIVQKGGVVSEKN